jgi:hypothetical protein
MEWFLDKTLNFHSESSEFNPQSDLCANLSALLKTELHECEKWFSSLLLENVRDRAMITPLPNHHSTYQSVLYSMRYCKCH